MKGKDIVFLSETHVNVSSLEKVRDFTAYGDPNFALSQKHGGMAVYINTMYVQYVTDLRFTKCTLSFAMTTIPDVFFMGVYVYPQSSANYCDTDFAVVINEINYWISRGFHPYIGGDFNTRAGDLNKISSKSLKWRYAENVDAIVNQSKSHFADMCETLKILPLSHCIYNQREFHGCFTYFNSNRKSQIDFALTDNVGRRNVTDFKLTTTGWHFSDHLPVDLIVRVNYDIKPVSLLIRSKELLVNTKPNNNKNFIRFYPKDFDVAAAKDILSENAAEITQSCISSQSADFIVNTLHSILGDVITKTATRKKKSKEPSRCTGMKECDTSFRNYLNEICKDEADPNHISELYNVYQKKRKDMNFQLASTTTEKYRKIIESQDSKQLWEAISWSGDICSKPINHPPISEITEHFSQLYEPIEDDGDINSLSTDVNIPETDDPVSAAELEDACKQMKKGGYDFPASCVSMLMASFGAVLLLLMNLILIGQYPLQLCISILSAIPKVGNLRSPENYRGIQMQRLLSIIYDRVLFNRLLRWASISDEQTAFQQGKGTIDQTFLLRTVISLAKSSNTCLYIGFFDLSKAFDRVSRFLLLKHLIKLGIGSVMFCSLACMYSTTKCVLKGFGKLSEVFQTYTGIRQGAPSSVILFIVFLDDIISRLKDRCDPEPILRDLHCLLHADDTVIISTNREQFIHKCNVLLEILKEKKMLLNYKKSAYFIINGDPDVDIKCALKLNSGWLVYKALQKYLGTLFSDSGVLKDDVSLFLDGKSKDLNVKLASCLHKNEDMPVTMKFNVVSACINASLTYGCEAWGSTPLNKIEALQRKALKMVLGVSKNAANDIVYVESGFEMLKPMICKRQLKFYQKMLKDSEEKPTSPIAVIIKEAIRRNVTFIRHYKKLHEQFQTPNQCFKQLNNELKTQRTVKFEQCHAADKDSILGTYKRINPTLTTSPLYQGVCCFERGRTIITRYRMGCHKLKIQSGRFGEEEGDRTVRLCICGESIQTIEHALFFCPLTENVRNTHNLVGETLDSFFNSDNFIRTSTVLRTIEKIYGID